MALTDALVHELYGLTEEEIQIVKSPQMSEAVRPLRNYAGPDAGR
jgi:hypothetical protein